MITRQDFTEICILINDVLEMRSLGLDFTDKYHELVRNVGWAIMEEDGETDPDRISIALSKRDLSLKSTALRAYLELCEWLITQDHEFSSQIELVCIDTSILSPPEQETSVRGGFSL